MYPYIIALRQQNTNIQGQVSGTVNKSRQLQSQVGRMWQDAEAAKQDLATVKDTAQKAQPKIAKLNQDIGSAAADLGDRVATVKDTLRQTTAQIASVGIKAEQALSNTVQLSADLIKAKQDLQTRAGQLSNSLDETTTLARAAQNDVRSQSNRLQGHLNLHDTSILRFSEALSGNIKLYAAAIADDISAAALNAAAAGTFTRELTVSLVSELGEGESAVRYVHPWALLPAIITAEASADPDIDPPEVKDYDDPLATPQFQAGLLHLTVILDTDAGVTKTYVAEDEVSVTVKVSGTVGGTPGTSKLLGWDVADFVMTYTVIA